MEEQETDKINQRLLNIWRSRKFQIFIDICRIVMAITAIIILVVLIKEIEAVKLLSLDPCLVCIEKTGCYCNCNVIPLNISDILK